MIFASVDCARIAGPGARSIYAFPVQQLVEFVCPTSDWRLNLALSLPITLAFAVLSWKFVEQPGLKIGKDVSAWLDARRDKGRRVSVC